MGSAATLRQALTRFRAGLDPGTCATLDAIGNMRLALSPECANLTDEQIAARVDKRIADDLALLKDRRRYLLKFDAHARARPNFVDTF